MTAAETRPQPIIRPDGDDEQPGRLRPRERRILQAGALICAVSAILVLQWTDERNGVEKNLKPPEKVTTVRPGQIGELVGAQWKVIGRQTGRPLSSSGNDVAELQIAIAVRPRDAASAKSVDSYGLVYRLVDDEGHEWSAMGTKVGEPRPGVAMRVTVRGTVPRTKADSLDLRIQAPKAERKQGAPLLLLRFEH